MGLQGFMTYQPSTFTGLSSCRPWGLWHDKNGSTVDGWTECKPEAFEETEETETNIDLLDWSTLAAVINTLFMVPSNLVLRQVDGILKNGWSWTSSF